MMHAMSTRIEGQILNLKAITNGTKTHVNCVKNAEVLAVIMFCAWVWKSIPNAPNKPNSIP